MILGSLIEPGLGLIVWTTIVFILLLVILAKFAWKPILTAIKTREQGITDALASADRALNEVRELKSNNERLLAEGRAERDNLLKEAREMKESIINEAKSKATKDAERIMQTAREQIINEKNAAITDLKNQVATLSIDIAEKILKSELTQDEKQKTLVGNLMKDLNLN
ncbi:MAG: F0F1 ATP synthase subunit B [Bacteroidetes bacterium]|jgi:F-type H+-transporting ATPase subunit b|nr:F0F1 ATP synthase subunit B [Bacteroidota bacterium]MCA6442873.1 F0F1 ATP synthase subunit B [Bacteroidota bacterium]